jgi:hypothetical protein
MIYLFNSGFRPHYQSNALNTLFLPKGSINCYRYHESGDNVHVTKEFISQLSHLSKDESLAIIFVDRFSPGEYTYHPVRLGSFQRFELKDERVYIFVKLTDYVYPKNITSFNAHARKALLELGGPRLVGNDPECTADGNYALLGQDIFQPESDYIIGKDAWPKIVRSLETTQAFKSTRDKPVVFMKVEIQDQNGHTIYPKIRNGESSFDIVHNKHYKFCVNYQFPIQNKDTSHVETGAISLDDPPFRLISDNQLKLDTTSTFKEFNFTTKRYPEDTSGILSIQFTNNNVISPDKAVELNLVEQKSLWLITFFLLFFFSLFGWITTSVDFANFDWCNVYTSLMAEWPKLVFLAFQSVILFVLLKIFGKKIV